MGDRHTVLKPLFIHVAVVQAELAGCGSYSSRQKTFGVYPMELAVGLVAVSCLTPSRDKDKRCPGTYMGGAIKLFGQRNKNGCVFWY